MSTWQLLILPFYKFLENNFSRTNKNVILKDKRVLGVREFFTLVYIPK
jgi:hypothetical protein